MKTEPRPKTCIFCENEIQENWVNCPNCGFDLSAWNTFEKNVETYRDFMLELSFDLRILKETLKTNITNPSTSLIKIFEAIKKIWESNIEIIDPILKSKYMLLKTVRNQQCAHGEKDFRDIKLIGFAFNVLDFMLQECYGVISSYNKEISVFVPPNTWDDILKKINNTNLVVLSGDPFSGKTTTLYNIARFFSDNGYKIENNIENIRELFDGKKDSKKPRPSSEKWNQKYIFILDDIFGDTQFDPSLENFWSKKIITILNNPQSSSKFLIGIRKNILEEFLKTNDEIQIFGKLIEFKKSIFELGIRSYDTNDLTDILKNNAGFIKLEAPKIALLLININKITQKLILPGDIYNFLEEDKNTDKFDEKDLNKIIQENNSGVNVFTNRLIRLKEYEKIFLYNLYLNQDFSITDLKAIYQGCLFSGLNNRSYFDECINSLEGIIKIKIESQWINKIKKIDFVHPIYKDAIENLINENKEECNRLENIINKLFNLLQECGISDWKSNSNKYDTLRFHIFQTALLYYANFSFNLTKDHVIEILNSLSYEARFGVDNLELSIWNDIIEISNENVKSYPTSRYIEKLFYNYDKFDDELKNKFNSLFNNINCMGELAYCFAYYLDPQTVVKFQKKLKDLSRGNDEAKSRIAKCIIKNYDYIDDDNKKILFSMGVKITVIKYLIHNFFDLKSNELKNLLFEQIQLATESELIETGKTFLVNYVLLPEEIKQKYEFIFSLKNELIIKQVEEAFATWFSGAFTDIDYDKRRETPDKKVLDLYCDYLTNEKIVFENLEEMMGFYESADYGTLGYSIFHYPNKENSSNKKNPKWNNSFYSKLKNSLETNMTILLSSMNMQIEKEYVYSDAFLFYSFGGNRELFNKIKNIFVEKKDTILKFLDILEVDLDLNENDSNNPFALKISQIDIINKLTKPPDHPTIRATANEILNYINPLLDKHIFEITKDDYS